MKVWVTGAHGLVGRAVEQYCRERWIEYVATGKEVDISRLSEVEKFLHAQKGITHLINCAAYTNVDEAEKHRDTVFAINARGPENLGRVSDQHGIKLIHLSTDYVFGLGGDTPFKEVDACHPIGIYAKAKREGEVRLLEVNPHACIIRTSWVFGKGGKGYLASLYEKLHREEKIVAVSDQVSRLTYVKDLVQVIFELFPFEGVFHFANLGEVSRYDVAKKMWELLKEREVPIACKEVIATSASSFRTLAPRPSYSALDTKKVETVLGTFARSWQEVLEEYVHEQL